jgi:hypothetical protein
MNKKLLDLLILFICFLCLSEANAKINCTGADLIFTNITIDSVQKSGNINYYYSYTIKNIGTDPVQLNKVIIQNYVSQDNVYDNGDYPAGGSYIDYFGTSSLAAGDSYSGIYEAAATGKVSDKPYLIPLLEYAPGECDATNNTMIVCLYTDANIPSLTFTNVTATSIDFNYDLKNVGGDTLFLNKATIEFYGSMDNTLDGSDKLLEAVINAGNTFVLANKTDTDSYTASRSNNYFYTYIIAKITYNGTECNTSNNTTALSIPAVTAILDKTNEIPTVIINRESSYFYVKEWNQTSDLNNLKFSIFNCNGSSMISGKTSINESISIQGLSRGIYILEISNNDIVSYQRFVY